MIPEIYPTAYSLLPAASSTAEAVRQKAHRAYERLRNPLETLRAVQPARKES
jgi:hypothetical protein